MVDGERPALHLHLVIVVLLLSGVVRPSFEGPDRAPVEAQRLILSRRGVVVVNADLDLGRTSGHRLNLNRRSAPDGSLHQDRLDGLGWDGGAGAWHAEGDGPGLDLWGHRWYSHCRTPPCRLRDTDLRTAWRSRCWPPVRSPHHPRSQAHRSLRRSAR